MLVHSVTLMNTSKQLNRALLRYHQHPQRWLNFGRPCLLALLFPPVEKWIQKSPSCVVVTVGKAGALPPVQLWATLPPVQMWVALPPVQLWVTLPPAHLWVTLLPVWLRVDLPPAQLWVALLPVQLWMALLPAQLWMTLLPVQLFVALSPVQLKRKRFRGIGTYYCLNMIIITMSCFLNVLIVDLTAHGTRANKPPSCIWLYYNVLARFLRMTDLVRPLKAAIEKAKTPNKRYEDSDKWTHHHDASASNEALAQLHQEQIIRSGGPMAEIEDKLCELRSFIRDQRKRMDEKDRKELLAKHWKAVALISDRIFFIVYLIIIVGSLGYTLPVLASSGKGLESRLLEKAKTRM
ncbi:hypothetical protein ACOMHN_041874 [Nucella lapillus]